MSRINEIALDFLNTFSDQFEDEIYTEDYIKKMTDKEARSFILDEINNTLAGDGEQYLFDLELDTMKELKLWKECGMTEQELDQLIYNKNKVN